MDTSVGLIADYAYGLRFSDLSAAAVHHCKRCVIDTFGCALGGFGAKPSRIARELAQRASVPSGARILGTSHRTLPELAAFANGAAARYLDGNDLFPGGGGHPSNTIAAVLAASDIKGADGRSVITAIALAYEIYYSLYQAAHPFDKGIDHAFNTAVGGAVGAAKVLGLDKHGIAEAVSLAITPNIALDATRYGHLSMWKGCAEANGARNAVFAALLAAAGMTGPEKPIEGAHGLHNLLGKFEFLPFAAEGREFAICGVTIKCFLAVAHALPLITVALPLSQQVAAEDIEAVTMYTYRFAHEVTGKEREKWRPTTREAADHSLPYILAAVLIDRSFSDKIFSDARLSDPRIRELIDKIEIKEDVELTRRFPHSMPCRIEIKTRHGEHKVGTADNPRGHDKNPMTDQEVNDKFRGLALRALPPQRVEEALAALWRLDTAAGLGEIFDAVDLGRQPSGHNG